MLNKLSIILIVLTLLLPIFICFLFTPILWLQQFLIFKNAKKYPKILKKMLIFAPFIRGNIFRMLSIIFKETFLFESFSKKKFNNSFNKLYNYKEISNLKDIKLSSLIQSHKKLMRFYLFIFNFYFVTILIFTILGWIIFLLFKLWGIL